ncbi:aldo/keto reductase [Brevundimonas sp. Leaf363]|uniref:aldo/keto reductase n=1 Tax=Brevundimonas sp. Leaf363 TaxID=1736353 RepID=UPI0009E877F9|nr:aldo/keto reductase [Brevundimonas sp. Leaf363]
MTVFTSSSPGSRLALAVVTAPERTHNPAVAATGAREEAIRHLLQTAADAGIGLVATRPEGDGERLLGQAWPFPSPFQVSVRTLPLSEGLDRVEARARRSLERLGLPRGDVLLVSNAAELAGADGRALWDRLQGLKAKGLYRRIGVCATLEDGPALLARRLQPDVVQIGCNLLDQRADRDGTLAAIAGTGAEIHLSSVFAGGLLFAGGDSLPAAWAGQAMALSRTRRRLAEQRCDPMQGALAYAFQLPGVTRVITSIASSAELRAVLAAAHAPCPKLDWSTMAVEAPAVAEASAAVSSAA